MRDRSLLRIIFGIVIVAGIGLNIYLVCTFTEMCRGVVQGLDLPEYPNAELKRWPVKIFREPTGSPPLIKIYATPDSAEKVLRFFDEELVKVGWERIDKDPTETIPRYSETGVENMSDFEPTFKVSYIREEVKISLIVEQQTGRTIFMIYKNEG